MVLRILILSVLGAFLGRFLCKVLTALPLIVAENAGIDFFRFQSRNDQQLSYIKPFIVESMLALLFGFLGFWIPFGPPLFFIPAVSFLLVGCFLTDLRAGLLLDQCTLGLVWIGLLASLFPLLATSEEAIMGAVLGYGVFWIFNVIYKYFRGFEGMYPGDFKLNAGIGACFGWKLLLPILLTSLLLLLLCTAIWFLCSKRKKWVNYYYQEIPYGCFASLVTLLALYAQIK